MSAVVVDGFRMPTPVAGDVALDFCNTRAWGGTDAHEYLLGYGQLATWAGHVGLLPRAAARRLVSAGRRDPEAAAVLDRAVELRQALRTVALAPRAGAAWRLVAAEAATARAAGELRPAAGGARWTWDADRAGLALPVLAVADAAAELLTSGRVAAVRMCGGTGCGWLFHDPRGRRRWCEMSVCGNRAKARRHAARAAGRRRQPAE